ncbi:hypothetical protein B6U66_03360 [Candidatus Bathyarchaeota archaeon ex4484_135]|nr:MAG: hypothetical protein B6U66_03360 [Candidatus Bathyarchaeota archaeon ex4484_135]
MAVEITSSIIASLVSEAVKKIADKVAKGKKPSEIEILLLAVSDVNSRLARIEEALNKLYDELRGSILFKRPRLWERLLGLLEAEESK